MKRLLLVAALVLAWVLGLGMLAVGGSLLATFGRDGSLSVESGRVEGAGAALVSDGDGISAGPLQRRLGTLTLGARSPSGQQLFLGIARADDVFAYLEGVPYDVVAEVGPDGAVVRPVPGRAAPADPASQSFWVRSATGTDPTVEWTVSGADERYVVMLADGGRGVTADLLLGFRSDTVFPVGLGLVIAGAVLTVVALVLTLVWWRRRARAAGTPPPVEPVPAPVEPGQVPVPVEPVPAPVEPAAAPVEPAAAPVEPVQAPPRPDGTAS